MLLTVALSYYKPLFFHIAFPLSFRYFCGTDVCGQLLQYAFTSDVTKNVFIAVGKPTLLSISTNIESPFLINVATDRCWWPPNLLILVPFLFCTLLGLLVLFPWLQQSLRILHLLFLTNIFVIISNINILHIECVLNVDVIFFRLTLPDTLPRFSFFLSYKIYAEINCKKNR